jgi:hypothetical protein
MVEFENDIFVCGYDPITKRFTMIALGNEYTFTYDATNYVPKNFKRADESKICARTYKGFRVLLGIVPSSPKAARLIGSFTTCKKHLELG